MPRELLMMQNNYEWTDAEGRLITADKALSCKARNFKVEGQTYQNLYKMENVKFTGIGNGGSQEFKSDGYYYLNKTASDVYCDILQDLTLNIKPNTLYTLVVDIRINTLSNNINFNAQYEDRSWFIENAVLSPGESGRKIYTLTSKNTLSTHSNTRPLRTQLSPQISGILEYKVILLEGDFTNTDLPTEINGIESVAEREIKNLLENVKWHDGWLNADGSITTSTKYPNGMYSDLIDIDINTLYYCDIPQNYAQIRIRPYKSDGTGINSSYFVETFQLLKEVASTRSELKDCSKIRILIIDKTVTSIPAEPLLVPNLYADGDKNVKGKGTWHQLTLPINLKPNTNYIASVDIESISKGDYDYSPMLQLWYKNENGEFKWLKELTIDNSIKSFKTPSYFSLFQLRLVVNGGIASTTDCEANFKSIAIYEKDLYPVNIVETNYDTDGIDLPMPLRRLPNGTKDTIEGNKLIQRVNKTILDGSDDENWVLNNGYLETGTRLNRNAKSNSSMISNYPVVNISYTQENKPYGTIITDEGKLRVVTVTTGNETDLSQAKARLQQNPLEVYYELETPIEHELNIPPISIAKGGNIVTTSNNIQPNMKFKYKKVTRKKPIPKPPTNTYLYNLGNEGTELTGGYLTATNNSISCNIEKQADNLYVNCIGKTNFDSICYARTNKTIKPCKIKVSVKNNSISANGIAFCVFLSEKEAINSVSDFNSIVNKKYIKASNTTPNEYIDLEMDLTASAEGYFYIACMVAGDASYKCEANIKKIKII